MHKPIRMITLLLIFTFRNPRDCIWIEDARRHRYRPYIHVRWRISLSMIVMAGVSLLSKYIIAFCAANPAIYLCAAIVIAINPSVI